MLNCTISGFSVQGINVNLTIDGAHSFTITGRGTVPAIGSSVTIKRDNTSILVGTVTKTSRDSSGNVNISGQDSVSYYFENNTVSDIQLSETTSTNLSAASALISNRITCPSQSCYGFGSFSGTLDSYVNRIANSFGLHYLYSPTGNNVELSAGVVEPSGGTAVPTVSYSSEVDDNNRIGTIYLQKTVTVPEEQETSICNGSKTETITTPLHNSLLTATSAYPVDVFIDPGSWNQVRLHTNAMVTTHDQALEVTPCRQVKITGWSDTTSDPRWQLFLYNDDDLLYHGDATSASYNWRASDDEVCNKMVIARYKRDVLPPEIEYPDCDGITCYISVWETLPSGIDGWEHTATSGDGGRSDFNIIDEPMFPAWANIDGTRIAKRDSNPNGSTIVTPGTNTGNISLNETTYINRASATAEFAKVQVPLVGMSMTENGNNSQTTLTGEW